MTGLILDALLRQHAAEAEREAWRLLDEAQRLRERAETDPQGEAAPGNLGRG